MAKEEWRDNLKRKLLRVLKDHGVETFLETAVAALSVDPHGDGKMKSQFVGEVCEIVMLGLTQRYLTLTGKDARIFHSVVLKDLKSPKSDFRTECDFVLVSPSFVLTTECKSYCGEVTISKECTLTNQFHEVDVYKQSQLHFDKLYLYAQQAVKPASHIARVPVFATAFVFSESAILDKRTQVNRDKLQVLSTATLFDYYDALFERYTQPVFDYEKLCKVLGMASRSKKLHGEHAEFVGY